MAIRIFITDDHMLLRQGLRQILGMESDFEIVGDAATGTETLENIHKDKRYPDILLLDMNLPDMTGIDVVRQLAARHIKTKIIVLTVNDGTFYVVEMLKLGVKGYVLKGVEPETLVEAVRTVAGGGIFIDKELTGIVQEICGEDPNMAMQAKKFCLEQQDTRLTVREMEVLKCIAAGMSNIDMAKKLYVSDKTIKNHLTSIYRKLNVADRTQALIYAYKHGMVGEVDGLVLK